MAQIILDFNEYEHLLIGAITGLKLDKETCKAMGIYIRAEDFETMPTIVLNLGEKK